MNRARLVATIVGLTSGGNAIALMAVSTAAIGMFHFDDPLSWGAAGIGIAAAHYSIQTVSRGVAILNGIAGVGISVFVSPWLAYMLAIPFEGSRYKPLPAYAVIFLVAWGWGWVFRQLQPIVSAWRDATAKAGTKRIKKLGGD